MSNVVSLVEYKRQKEEEEIEKLSTELADLLSSLGELEYIPEPYFVFAPTGSNMTYDSGPNVESCIVDLRSVSHSLKTLGKTAASDEIENIVKKLNSKEN